MLSTAIHADASGEPDSAYEEVEAADAPETKPEAPVKKQTAPKANEKAKPNTPLTSFTGKVIKNKVRLRAQPTMDSAIIKELGQGDLLIVLDENDDFYAIQPPKEIKAYVFRTFVLDNIVEGSKVNVRLSPDVDAPVIGQLKGGDRVNGTISTQNNKWLEIQPPASVRFYVAKEYVEKIGDANLMSKIERRRNEVNLILNSATLSAQNEMQKDFPEINLESATAGYNKVIKNFTDFPDQVEKAKTLLAKLQEDYMKKKIPYLEAKASQSSQLDEKMKSQQEKLSLLEQQLQKERANKSYSPVANTTAPISAPKAANYQGINDKMNLWSPVEQNVYQTWSAENDNGSMEDFYQQQGESAVAMKGIIEPYTRVVKNKPGDYVLMNQTNHLPIAFLYSTQVNLQDHVGREVTVYGVTRPNNNFAYPAYFVLGLD
jgi:hypothetical protein